MQANKKDADRIVSQANRSGVFQADDQGTSSDDIDKPAGSDPKKKFAHRERPSREGLLTRQRAAELLAISLRKLDQLISSQDIAVARFGRSVRIEPRELDRFVERCSRGGEGVRQ